MSAARVWKFAVAAGAIALAAFLLARVFGQYSFAEIRAAVSAVPLRHIVFAAGFAAASYFCMTLFDALGLRYAGRRLPYWHTALTSFTALSLGHNVGFGALSSGPIRYRFYARFGLTTEEVAKVILFCAVTVGLGLLVLGGIALVARSDLGAVLLHLPRTKVAALGAMLLAIPLVYIGLNVLWARRKLHFRTWSFELPGATLAAAQLLVGSLNYACVAGCLYEALLPVRDVTYTDTVLVYALADAATLLTHAPGGIGVVEWVVLTLLPGSMVVGALVIFRCVYYFVPLCLGIIALAVSEVVLRPQSTKSQRPQRLPPLLR